MNIVISKGDLVYKARCFPEKGYSCRLIDTVIEDAKIVRTLGRIKISGKEVIIKDFSYGTVIKNPTEIAEFEKTYEPFCNQSKILRKKTLFKKKEYIVVESWWNKKERKPLTVEFPSEKLLIEEI